jgi:hypothetical protein
MYIMYNAKKSYTHTYTHIYIYTYGNYIWICGLLNIRTGILDYFREGFSWPTLPFEHTESNSFKRYGNYI